MFRKAPGADVTTTSVERGMDSFRLASLAAASGVLSEAGGGAFALVRSESRTTKELVEELRARPDVAAVSANHTVRIAAVPNDPDYGRLWGLSAIRAPEAWEVTTGSDDVCVALIDSGIDTAHEDLAGGIDPEHVREDGLGLRSSGREGGVGLSQERPLARAHLRAAAASKDRRTQGLQTL